MMMMVAMVMPLPIDSVSLHVNLVSDCENEKIVHAFNDHSFVSVSVLIRMMMMMVMII